MNTDNVVIAALIIGAAIIIASVAGVSIYADNTRYGMVIAASSGDNGSIFGYVFDKKTRDVIAVQGRNWIRCTEKVMPPP